MGISHNSVLKRLWEQVNVREWTYIGTEYSKRTLDILAQRHTNIYDALQARDPEKASYEARKHIEDLLIELAHRSDETYYNSEQK